MPTEKLTGSLCWSAEERHLTEDAKSVCVWVEIQKQQQAYCAFSSTLSLVRGERQPIFHLQPAGASWRDGRDANTLQQQNCAGWTRSNRGVKAGRKEWAWTSITGEERTDSGGWIYMIHILQVQRWTISSENLDSVKWDARMESSATKIQCVVGKNYFETN